MRRSDSDLISTPEHQLDRLSQDELLRLVVICRDDPSRKRKALEAWKTLVALDIDRVRGIVAAFTFPGQPGVRVQRDHIEDVVDSAYERLVRMLRTFKGASEGEYRAAMRTCVRYECMDHCRDEMGWEKPLAGSLDQQVTDKEGKGRLKFEPEIAKKEQERIDEQEAQERELELQRRVREAIESLDGNRRKVLELTLAGRSSEEIAAELETSRDNAYQLRARGIRDLRQILDADVKP